MGYSALFWLFISSCWVWGIGCRTVETVLGTLGKATVLGVPSEFQNLTQRSGTATWKRSMENPLSKEYLFTYNNGNYTNYKPGEILFHLSNFSLEILSTQRQDQQLYEYSITMEAHERNWQIQLEVYEPVSDPSIHILDWMLANDSCTVTLNCTVAQGDNVSYSWASSEASTSPLCTHNGSLLLLSYDPTNSILPCTCTASNPVSSRTTALRSSICSTEQQGQPREQSPPTEDSTVHTIYSQVQRVEKPKSPCSPPGTDHPTCTTIYAAATGASLPPHSPQGANMEPMTVYASVMLPIS
uniref:Signaling lymphocytic activation molecule family member 1 n=1 Tax=Gallus gallus TaxID=9031 RepID=A0A8V1A9U4_CHICK